MAIKAQSLTDFVVEFTYDVALEPRENLPEVKIPGWNPDKDITKWKSFVDGLPNQHGVVQG